MLNSRRKKRAHPSVCFGFLPVYSAHNTHFCRFSQSTHSGAPADFSVGLLWVLGFSFCIVSPVGTGSLGQRCRMEGQSSCPISPSTWGPGWPLGSGFMSRLIQAWVPQHHPQQPCVPVVRCVWEESFSEGGKKAWAMIMHRWWKSSREGGETKGCIWFPCLAEIQNK